MKRNKALAEMDSNDLIEIAYAVNSDYPGQNEKAKKSFASKCIPKPHYLFMLIWDVRLLRS